jgi:hypothetical protein
MCNQVAKFMNRLPFHPCKLPWIKFKVQKLGITLFFQKGGAKILTQGGLTSKYGNIQCKFYFQISRGGQI